MSDAKTLRVDLADRSYDITVGKGLLDLANKHMNLSRRVAIVTDSGVPKKYAEVIASLCDESKIITFPEG